MALGSIEDIEAFAMCFGAMRDNVRDFCRLCGEVGLEVVSNLGDRGCIDEREFLANGSFVMDNWRRKDGRLWLAGVGMTKPSRFA